MEWKPKSSIPWFECESDYITIFNLYFAILKYDIMLTLVLSRSFPAALDAWEQERQALEASI